MRIEFTQIPMLLKFVVKKRTRNAEAAKFAGEVAEYAWMLGCVRTWDKRYGDGLHDMPQ